MGGGEQIAIGVGGLPGILAINATEGGGLLALGWQC